MPKSGAHSAVVWRPQQAALGTLSLVHVLAAPWPEPSCSARSISSFYVLSSPWHCHGWLSKHWVRRTLSGLEIPIAFL